MNTNKVSKAVLFLHIAASICCTSIAAYPQKPTIGIAHTSKPKGKDGIAYITAFFKNQIYILSCLGPECRMPTEGKNYEFTEETSRQFPENHYVFLTGFDLNNQQYDLEVKISGLPVKESRDLIELCLSSDSFVNEAECGKWIVRKLLMQMATCPDPESVHACQSFKELLSANDVDIIDDFAKQDHVYACFLPGKDEFFEVTYSEPTWWGFEKPSKQDLDDGVPSEALTTGGGSEFAYYKNGVGDSNKSLHNIGKWTYLPLGERTDLHSMRKNATSKKAKFKGKNITIENDRWTLSEDYKNQAGSETRHSVILQLATGRFTEAFTLIQSGKSLDELSGRCLIVPSNYF